MIKLIDRDENKVLAAIKAGHAHDIDMVLS